MLVRKQTMSSVPFPSNTGETGSQKKGFGTQPGDAFTMPWFWQAWPFHLLQPWAIQCGWNRKQLGTHCDCSIWHKHALGKNAPICCIQWGNANRVTLDSRLISLFSVSGPSLIGSWGGCQAQPWAGMLAPSWALHGHPCATAPVPAPIGPSRCLRARQRGFSTQSSALAPTPHCSAWDCQEAYLYIYFYGSRCGLWVPVSAELFVFCFSSAGPTKGCSCQMQRGPEPLSTFLSHCSGSLSDGW